MTKNRTGAYNLQGISMIVSQMAAARRARDRMILRAYENGCSCAAIARHAGLSRQGVLKIVQKNRDNSVDKSAEGV